MQILQIALGQKAATKLSLITGASVSACEKWLAGKREPGGQHLVEILRSEVGREALKYILNGSVAAWAQDWRRHQEMIALRKLSAETNRRLAVLENGDLPL